jgi:hypothetical protein
MARLFDIFYNDWKLLQNIFEVGSISDVSRSDPHFTE